METNTKIKIGITDLADPALDLSWIDKLSTVDGAIIITKGIFHAPVAFYQALLDNKNKIILHCTVTGLGGTELEPGTTNWHEIFVYLRNIINNGFPVSHIVVRIDPIIGGNLYSQFIKTLNYEESLKEYSKIISWIVNAAYKLGIRRIRYSYLDLYDHVRSRFEKLGYQVPDYAVPISEIKFWNNMFTFMESFFDGIRFESCAERFAPEHHQVGCISKRDFEILGINPALCIDHCDQRPTCLCSANKVELLPYAKECEHNCLYCFIKH